MTNELPLVHRALDQAAVSIHTLKRVTAFDGRACLALADVYHRRGSHACRASPW